MAEGTTAFTERIRSRRGVVIVDLEVLGDGGELVEEGGRVKEGGKEGIVRDTT